MSSSTRILVVEDLPSDAELCEREIKKVLSSCEFRRVETCNEYLAALDEFRPSLIVSDFKLPRFDGLTALKLAVERAPDVPFIILTGSMNEDTAVECMKAGAWDYVIKEHIKRLGQAILGALDQKCLRQGRMEAEAALRESEQRLREAQRLGRIGHWEYDLETRRIRWSDMVFTIYDRDPKLGPPTEEEEAKYYSPEEARLLRDRSRMTIETGEPYEVDVSVKLPGGRSVETSVIGASVKDPSERVVGLRGTVQDITARKRAEAEKRKLEEQLRASQKMEAVGSLAGGIAHDFNNLLSVILNYTTLAVEGLREGDPMRDDLLEVTKAAECAVELTRQLLAFSRKQMLKPVPLNLNQIAAGLEKMLRRILGEDIDFVQVLAPDLGVVRADPGQIDQVLMNLVVNARDAMPKGGKLTVETSNVEIDQEFAAHHMAVKPGSYVQIAVTDTGCGMDEQTRARIFEPFFTTKEKSKGTGLGLSTVYGIVKQSGGNIWVYSEPGQGTTFKIYLPRELTATTAMAIKPSTVPRRSTGTETILVVEDEEALRKVTRRSLSAAGYTVLTAANGDEALLTCAQHVGDIHLLLTDVVMPRLSGRMLAQELSKRRPKLKVLYMSGYTDNAIVHHGILDGGTHFLGKPFTAADLTRKVREVLDGGITDLADEQAQAIKPGAERKEGTTPRQECTPSAFAPNRGFSPRGA